MLLRYIVRHCFRARRYRLPTLGSLALKLYEKHYTYILKIAGTSAKIVPQ